MAQAHETEAAVEAHLRRAVKELGGYTMKLLPADKGAPDRLVLLPGGVIRFVEVKRVGGRLSRAQLYWINRAGGLGTPVDTVFGKSGVDGWARIQKRNLQAERSSTDLSVAGVVYYG